MVRVEWLGIAVLLGAGCAANKPRPSDAPSTDLVRAFEDALVADGTDLPKQARTKGDIVMLSRARQVAAACTPGRSSMYPLAWLERHRDNLVHTSEGEQTVGAIATRCAQMLSKVEQRPVEACGARYVQLERHLGGDDAWSAPRITHASDGWYMIPCDRVPGKAPTREIKEARASILAACDDPTANVYVLARWTDQVGGKASTATAACFAARRERSDWLPGNPALSIK